VNFAADAEGSRTVYYASDGQVLFATAKATSHKGKRPAATDGIGAAPVYQTVASLPFNKLVSSDAPPADAPEWKAPSLVDGELDPDMVAKFVKSQLLIVKGCYERELAKNRDLKGKVVMHWTIDHGGTTRDVAVEQVDPDIAQAVPCIVDVVKQWRFPPPAGRKVEVSFPFVFQTSEPDAGTASSKPTTAPPAPSPESVVNTRGETCR